MVRVEWREWSPASFEEARRQDKLVFLYVATAWEHWCRVMDEDTFQSPAVVERLNRDFIPIRVDAERAPDINDRYNMGGWPSTVFLTADGEIVWGSTYLAPDPMTQLLTQFKEGFHTYRQQIYQEIRSREEKIRQIEEGTVSGSVEVDIEIFRKTLNGIVATYDPMYGGFGRAPKFPMIGSMDVLLCALDETGGDDFKQIVIKTLDAMGDRGLNDPIDGGFFRYCTTETWSTPHYEKLCEDNAQVCRVFLNAAELLQIPRYAQKAEHTLKWAMKRLCDPERAIFFGSVRSDEAYYTTAPSERAGREPPSVDRTVFTDSNAMMSIAFLKAWACADDARYRDLALRNLEFLSTRMRTADGAFFHYYDGAAQKEGVLRDQVWMARLYLEAYQATGVPEHLLRCEEASQTILQRYWDKSQKGVRDRLVEKGDIGELRHPKKDLVENSLFAELLAQLSHLLEEKSYRTRAETIVKHFPDYLGQYGHFTAAYAMAVSRVLRPPLEVFLVSEAGQAPEPLRQAAYRFFHSQKIIRHLDSSEARRRGLDVRRLPAAILRHEGESLPPAATPRELLDRVKSLREG